MSRPEALRLAIVGAGPAGLSLAWYLRQLGFEHVDIFEASAQAGGQSRTEDMGGIPVEIGTCYMADGYVIAREIAHAAGTPPARLPPATFLDDCGRPITPDEPPMTRVLAYVLKWFGWYLSGQLRRPSDPDNALLFSDWLKKKGLPDMVNSMVFTDGCTAQLYGPLDRISAHDGLSWVRPSLLWTGRHEDTAHVPAGFQTMWRCLVDHLGYPVHFLRRVTDVRPVSEDGALRVRVSGEGMEPSTFDHVFLACPLDETGPDGKPRIDHPLWTILREDFAPFDDSIVYSGAWRARGWPLAAPSRCYLPACSTGEPGRLLTIRQYGKVGDEWVGQFCSYALDNEDRRADPGTPEERRKANRDSVERDMKDIVGLSDIHIEHDHIWRYSMRYSCRQFEQGLPAVIDGRQGAEHVWYTGGTLSHWDVDMISNFNQSLALRFAKAAGMGWLRRMRIVRLRDLFRDL